MAYVCADVHPANPTSRKNEGAKEVSKGYPPACCASGEGTLYFAEALSDYVGDRVKGWWRECTGSITGPIIIRAYRVGVLGSREAVEE